MNLGGERKARSSILTPEELKEVKQKIKNGVPYIDIEEDYNISTAFISSINNGVYFFDENEKYPLYKYYKNDEDYDELIDLLLHSEYSLKYIAEMLEMGYSTVKKINAGTLRHGLYPTYPIRTKSANEMRADKIKNLLMTTKYSNKEIANLTKSSEETVRRINVGICFKDEQLSYPLRNL